MYSKRLAAGAIVAVVALALLVTGAFAVQPKPGKFTGTAEPSGNKISLKVNRDDEVTVTYCNYKMKDDLSKSGKFQVAHKGPGGVYVGLKGGFPNKNTAKGEITTDFLCDSEGDKFTAKRV
jgi:hypothetical protein